MFQNILFLLNREVLEQVDKLFLQECSRMFCSSTKYKELHTMADSKIPSYQNFTEDVIMNQATINGDCTALFDRD